jgi:glucokinase
MRDGSPVHGFILGVDIGGTKTELALIDESGAVVRRDRSSTEPRRGAERVVRDVASTVRRLIGDLRTLGGVGVSVAGQVQPDGVVAGAPNLGWSGVPLGAMMADALGAPTTVVNDVRAATWAEWRHGAGRGFADLVVLYVGTGVGGGIVSGGRVLHGTHGTAGELGHTTLVAGGRRCHCRNLGCLEAYVSGWAIAERACEAGLGAPRAVTAEDVAALRDAGDTRAIALVRQTGELLGEALVSFINGFGPQRVILGGGVIEGFPELVDLAREVAMARALPAALAEVTIVRAALVSDAPVLGAAELARDAVLHRR